jgi:thioredoxin reductase/ferredoxin
VDGKPVAICRLKRVAADLRGEITHRLPEIPKRKNGFKIACVGAGPASLTVANDLLPLGYEVVIFERFDRAGGLMWTNIPQFRLPVEVLNEEIDMILDMGVDIRYDTPITSLDALLAEGYDAVFIGSGAPRGKNLEIPGRYESDKIHIGIDWLESVAFGHIDSIDPRVLIIGAGNTAMDCCRTSKRIGGTDVKVMARKPRRLFKASDWELEDAEEEQIEILENHSPERFLIEDGQVRGMRFEIVDWHKQPDIEFNEWDMPIVDRVTFQTTREGVFVGGDAAWGPENIIWAVAHGHEASISIHNYCRGVPVSDRPPEGMNLVSQKMGLHEWSYSNDYDASERVRMRHVELDHRFEGLDIEVEMGFDLKQTLTEVERCLNCDVQTHFTDPLCIECDACIDVCPVDCLTITAGGNESDLRQRLTAPAENAEQDLYVSGALPQTGRVMVKDEDICVHCGLCAERCPTAAWDMRQFELLLPYAGRSACATTP